MPDESVHCVVTSPPYWGLRDYGTARWEGGLTECDHTTPRSRGDDIKSGEKQGTSEGSRPNTRTVCKCGAVRIDSQLGLEPTPEAYVAKMITVFREVRRVLRSDGTCWVNLGDSYAASRSYQVAQTKDAGSKRSLASDFNDLPMSVPPGLKQKDLVGIPWMIAFALRADGWYLRSDIIWSKPNPMPESVTDRPTKSHEYVFLLSKSAKYFFDQDAVRIPLARVWNPENNGGSWAHTEKQPDGTKAGHHSGDYPKPNPAGANIRSVWSIATQPFSEAHFATFPERLVDRCISAGTSEKGVCGECWRPWVRIVEINDPEQRLGKSYHDHQNDLMVGQRAVPPANGAPVKTTTGWRSQCDHVASPVPATVMDIFSGSGTSGVVAHKLGRNYIGIELNPQYVAMSERRLGGTIYQPSLFG